MSPLPQKIQMARSGHAGKSGLPFDPCCDEGPLISPGDATPSCPLPPFYASTVVEGGWWPCEERTLTRTRGSVRLVQRAISSRVAMSGYRFRPNTDSSSCSGAPVGEGTGRQGQWAVTWSCWEVKWVRWRRVFVPSGNSSFGSPSFPPASAPSSQRDPPHDPEQGSKERKGRALTLGAGLLFEGCGAVEVWKVEGLVKELLVVMGLLQGKREVLLLMVDGLVVDLQSADSRFISLARGWNETERPVRERERGRRARFPH